MLRRRRVSYDLRHANLHAARRRGWWRFLCCWWQEKSEGFLP
jgi:hypothetical protein